MEKQLSLDDQFLESVKNGLIDDVRELLDAYRYKININLEDINGDQAIHIATYKNDWDMIRILINCGANIHARNSDGLQPIHLCFIDDITKYSLITAQVLVNEFNASIDAPLGKEYGINLLSYLSNKFNLFAILTSSIILSTENTEDKALISEALVLINNLRK